MGRQKKGKAGLNPVVEGRESRRIGRKLGWGALLSLLGLGLAYSQRAWLLAPSLKSWVQDWAKEEFDAELQLGQLSGSWLGSLELEVLEWSADSGPLAFLKGASLRAEYSLPGLLLGAAPQLKSLELSASDVTFDLDQLMAPASKASGEAAALPSLNRFTLKLSNVRLRGLGTQAALQLDEFSAEGSLQSGVLKLDHCSLVRGQDSLLLERLSVDLEGGSFLERLSVELRLKLEHPEKLWAGGLLPSGLRLDWKGSVAAGVLELEGELAMDGGRLQIERGGVRLPPPGARGRGPWWQELELDLDMQADFGDLAGFSALAGRQLGGQLNGKLELRGVLGDPHGFLRAQLLDAQVGEYAAERVDVDLKVSQGQLRIEAFEVLDADFEAKLDGLLTLSPLSFERLAVLFKSPDLGQLTSRFPGAQSVLLELNAWGALGALEGSYRLDTGALALPGHDLLSLHADGVFGERGVTLANLRATTQQGSIEAKGELQPLGKELRASMGLGDGHYRLKLDELNASSGELSCKLDSTHTSVVGPDRILIQGLRLVTQGGEATVDLDWDPGDYELQVSVDAFDAAPLLAPFLKPGVAVGSWTGDLTLSSPSAAAGQSVFDVSLLGQGLRPYAESREWSWGLEARYGDSLLEVTHLEALCADGGRLGASLRAPLALEALPSPEACLPGEVQLLVSMNLPLGPSMAWLHPDHDRWEGNVQATLSAGGLWNALNLVLVAGGEDLLPPKDWMDFGGKPHRFDAELSLGQGAGQIDLMLKGPLQAKLKGQLSWDGDLQALLADPEAWSALRLEAQAKAQDLDLAWLAKLSPETRGAEGRFSADVILQGPLGALQTTGQLSLKDGALRISDDLPLLRELQVELDMEQRFELQLEGSGELGGAPFSLVGRVQTSTEVPHVDLALEGENLLLVRNAEMRLRAGMQLHIQGPLDHLKVAGEVQLAEGRMVRNLDLLNGLLNRSRSEASAHSGVGFALAYEGPLASAEFDVGISSERAFRIDSNQAQIDLRPQLRLTGTGEVPIFIGSVFLGPSRLSLPSGRLNIRSGQFEFLASNPFEPVMTIEADINAQGYRVQALFGGSLGKPEIILSSQPPLANDELMQLFLTGRKPTGNSTQALESVAIYLANDFLTSWLFGQDAGAAEGYGARFDYESGAGLSRSGAPTRRATFLLHDPRNGPGRSYYLVGVRDTFDRFNYGMGVLIRFQ